MDYSSNQHLEVVDNSIPRDIRNLFPVMEEQPALDELARRVQADYYLEKTEEIYRLNLVSEKGAIDDLRRAMELEDPNLKGIVLGCLGGIHAFNGNYKKAFASFSVALDQKVTGDAKAYIITELSNLLRKLGYERESLSILEAGLMMTENERLRWRITTYMGLCQKYTQPQNALNILIESEKYYRYTNDYPRLGLVLRHIASTHIGIGQFEDAHMYIDQALAIADKHSLKSHKHAVINEKGWMLIQQRNYDKARDLFDELLLNELSPYDKSLALQNTGYLEFERHHFKEAIRFHSQSLRLTTWYEMRDMAFEDYYKLGLCHEKLADIGLADHFYSIGYKELMKEVEIGLPVLGYRKKLLKAYVQFLCENHKVPYIDVDEAIFGFTMNKSLKEIRQIFHKSLLNLHLEKSKNAPQLCQHLQIDTRTYFLYQKKLGLKRGKPIKAIHSDDPLFVQYIESLVSLTWREANKKFEGDLITYLEGKYQHNKKKMAEALQVSYAQILLKTKG